MHDTRTANNLIHTGLSSRFQLSAALLSTRHAFGHLVRDPDTHLSNGRQSRHFIANRGFTCGEIGMNAEKLRGRLMEGFEGGSNSRGEVGMCEGV